MKILLASDKDKDFEFDEAEIEMIIMRMSLMHGIKLIEDKLRDELNAIKGKKIEAFGKLSRDIYSRESSEYGITFEN